MHRFAMHKNSPRLSANASCFSIDFSAIGKEQQIFTGRRPVAVTFFDRNDTFDTRLRFSFQPLSRSRTIIVRYTVPHHELRFRSKTKLCATSAFPNAAAFDPPSNGAPSTFPIVFASPVRIHMCENRFVGDASNSADVRSWISFHFAFRLIFVRYGFRSTSGHFFKILVSRSEFLKATIERFSRR